MPFVGYFTLYFRKHAHYIAIGLGNFFHKSIDIRLCNVMEVHVFNYRELYITLVLSVFILHVTCCNSEDRVEGQNVHMANVELQVHHYANPSQRGDS